jgi:glycosyltransferase involved in cell wall biosynthesis
MITSSQLPLVSILINNYNYARFLPQAIDSALNQTYPHIEVVVVDDGSKDNSAEIIQNYGNKIVSVLKENGGQASAFNAGFEASSGDIICYLDADDVFHPEKVKEIVNLFNELNCDNVTIFNSLEIVDENNSPIAIDFQTCELSDFCYRRFLNKPKNQRLTLICTPAEVYQHASKYRYIPYLGSPTSGLAMTRSVAVQIFPIPSEGIRTSADDFLVKTASLLGEIYSTDLILSQYRVHGNNNWFGKKQNKPHPDSFIHTLDNFLNSKLESQNKKPVLSFFDSLRVKYYYHYHCDSLTYRKKLLPLIIKLITWHIDLRIIKFSIKTMREILFSNTYVKASS